MPCELGDLFAFFLLRIEGAASEQKHQDGFLKLCFCLYTLGIWYPNILKIHTLPGVRACVVYMWLKHYTFGLYT